MLTRTVYFDTVEFVDGAETEFMRDYTATEHTDAWLVWIWSDSTVRIPAHRIKMVTTTEE